MKGLVDLPGASPRTFQGNSKALRRCMTPLRATVSRRAVATSQFLFPQGSPQTGQRD